MKLREPRVTAMIFKGGQIVVTGAKSENDGFKAAKQFARMVKKLGNPSVCLTDFKIQNVVSSHDVGFQIRLETLFKLLMQVKQMQATCRYDPELFPGLIFKMKDPKVVFLIFSSGKIVLAGAKSIE